MNSEVTRINNSSKDGNSEPVYHALQDVQFASNVESDDGSPSEDNEFPQDARSVIGVSMSKAQTRLASPETPFIEKAAAIEEQGGFFNDVPDFPGEPGDGPVLADVSATPEGIASSDLVHGPTTPDSELPEDKESEDQNDVVASSPPRIPSPWRAGPKKFQTSRHSSLSSGILRDGFRSSRQRSSSGSEISRMKLPFGLPSLPQGFSVFGSGGENEVESSSPKDGKAEKRNVRYSISLPQTDGAVSWARESIGDIAARMRGFSLDPPREEENHASLTPTEQRQKRVADQKVTNNKTYPTYPPSSNVKRMKSDDSLLLQRALSRASSLGDDGRFENVQESINSRFKALKDSLQDANFKFSLPKAPAIFSNRPEDTEPEIPRSSYYVRQSNQPRFRDLVPPETSPNSRPKARQSSNPGILKQSSPAVTSYAAAHPYFSKALEELTGDLVILGGYRGSILRETKAPHRRVWVPFKVGLGLRKVDLEVPLDPQEEDRMWEKIFPAGMLTHIGPVDMARRLLKRLNHSKNVLNGTLRVHEYSYDWRLSPHKLSRDLIRFLRSLPCNRPGVASSQQGALVLAHSLGGLITRFAVNKRPELFSGVVYAGTPQTCVNILGPLRNGDDVLLSSSVLTAQVNFSIRTSFALLPLDGRCFIDKVTKEEYPVDFFNFDDWVDYRFSPCIRPPLPPLTAPPPGRLSSLMGSVSGFFPDSMASVLPTLPFGGHRESQGQKDGTGKASRKETSAIQSEKAAEHAEGGVPNSGLAVQMGAHQHQNPAEYGESTNSNVATAVTIPHVKAVEYLKRTLAEVKQFKENLAFIPAHAESNLYPPAAVIYGKSEPTVYGARVNGRDGIKRADAYDDLAFASGDGVVLARSAMLPDGYKAVRGGVVASDRGHITLLGDLEAVGRCLSAVIGARKLGIGMGKST